MKFEELKQNKELFEKCAKEVEARVRAGENPEQAKIKVIKAYGVEVDEDTENAAAVSKMELNEDELQNVSGGLEWCWSDHACFYVYNHDDEPQSHDEACFSDYRCIRLSYDSDGKQQTSICDFGVH